MCSPRFCVGLWEVHPKSKSSSSPTAILSLYGCRAVRARRPAGHPAHDLIHNAHGDKSPMLMRSDNTPTVTSGPCGSQQGPTTRVAPFAPRARLPNVPLTVLPPGGDAVPGIQARGETVRSVRAATVAGEPGSSWQRKSNPAFSSARDIYLALSVPIPAACLRKQLSSSSSVVVQQPPQR
jgi:hypothetical protein